MSTAVFFLTIVGICLIVASFIFFDKDSVESQNMKKVVMLNDYELDEHELAKLQENIRTVIKEYSDALVDDTNRQLSEVSNRKMMEISELAEQVLEDIKKAHKECVFLYDMLDDKSDKLKEYVSNSAEKLFAMQQDVMRVVPDERKSEAEEIMRETEAEKQVKEHLLEQVKQVEGDIVSKEILGMYEAGKPILTIAKELDLGVGEVQLVVDLFNTEQ